MKRLLAVPALLLAALLVALATPAFAVHCGAGGGRSGIGVHLSGRAVARVVLIGVPGLMWSDIDSTRTPHLWNMAMNGAVGSLSVKTVGTVACPYDGWLTVSAGVRSAVGYRCGEPPKPQPVPGGGAVIRGYSYLHQVAGQRHAGTLGAALRAAGRCAVAVGPGAALALADRSGRVDHYVPSLEEVSVNALRACPVTVIEVNDLIRPYLAATGVMPYEPEPLTPERREEAVRLADKRVGAALAALPPDTPVLVAGLSDHGAVPHLRVAMRYDGESSGCNRWLIGAASTRMPDVTILPDITATLLLLADAEIPPNVVGTPWEKTYAPDDPVDAQVSADVAGQTIRNVVGVFFTVLAVLQVAFYLTAFLLLRRGRATGAVRTAAVTLAAVPAGTHLVNLVRWETTGAPVLAMAAGIVVGTLLVAGAALTGPWRRHPLGPLAVVAGITAAVLAGDLLTGTTLQMNNVMGYTAVVGSRYFGLGNIPFALFATSVLLSATVLAHRLRDRPWAAVLAVVLLGGTAMPLVGWPGLGSDFGGVIAFVPGVAVTALLVSGRRMSLAKLVAFCAAGGVVVTVIAWLDYLRPPASQTHLGRFVGQVIAGEAIDVITRKLMAMLGTLLNPNLMPIVIATVAFLVYATLRPEAATAGVLPAAFERVPTLRAGLAGILTTGVVGMLVNDSGAAVLSMTLALAVPLVLTVGITALRERADEPLWIRLARIPA